MGIGWQKGINSDVLFAAITPATIAVANTGPFFPTISVFVAPTSNSNSLETHEGKRTFPYKRSSSHAELDNAISIE
jgi:hypothetical protein